MLVAVAEVESRFKPDARSQADARGLLQVLPSTGKSLNLSVDTPATNVLAGARYLKILLDRYSRTDLALAAYNAGPTAVDRAGGAPGAGDAVLRRERAGPVGRPQGLLVAPQVSDTGGADRCLSPRGGLVSDTSSRLCVGLRVSLRP